MGLDTTLYGHVRSNLLMEDEIASLSRVYALVLREERHRMVTKVKEETMEAAMAAQVTGNSARTSEPNKEEDAVTVIRCTYCNKLWHTEDKCWEKLKINGRGRGRGKSSRGRGGQGQHANAATTTSDDGKQGFTHDEMAQLRSLLSNKSEGSQSKSGPIYEDEDWEG
ncbi:uncharacterized protein LOC141629933 [Silene latifolia]|uniref:uncharacterized protein LOC141629933 n=1 Tax=Silene latifolia TaxID=37657 RepID=UPI003D770283